jgi:hypothetical protein
MEIDKKKVLMGVLLIVSIIFLTHIITTLLWMWFGEGWEFEFLPDYDVYMKDALSFAIIRMIIMSITSGVMIVALIWEYRKEK